MADEPSAPEDKVKPAKKQAPKRVRRGVVAEGADDAPVKLKHSPAAGPSNFDPATIAEKMNLWWENGDGDKFLIEDDKGWSVWNEKKIYKLLRRSVGKIISSSARDDEDISTFDQVMLHVMKERRVEIFLPSLGGYSAGVYIDRLGRRMIVGQSPVLVEAKQGEFPLISKILERFDLSGNGGDVDQRKWLWSWLKYADESRAAGPGNFASGHCLIMIGDRGCGKGFIQEFVITPLLGGREADPRQLLVSKKPDDFNAELIESEHWKQEELPLENQLMATRVMLSERIKDAVTKSDVRLRLMKTNPMMVYPFHRLSITINSTADKLRNLPLMTDDIVDKVIMLKVKHEPMPMPTDGISQRVAFAAAVRAELPAFLWWLRNEWEIPEELRTYSEDHAITPGGAATRFGFMEFQHPEFVDELDEETPYTQLLNIIDASTFGTAGSKLWDLPSDSKINGLWFEQALTLEMLLVNDEHPNSCSHSKEARKFFAHNPCDRNLGRLADREKKKGHAARVVHERYTSGVKKGKFGWMIQRPPD